MFAAALFMLASHAALCGLTGKFAMGVFQTLSVGKMGQLGAPGTGVLADATFAVPIAVRPIHGSAVAMHATASFLHGVMGVPLRLDGTAPLGELQVMPRLKRAKRTDPSTC